MRPFHTLAGLFPLMTGQEFEEFVVDVSRKGVLTPVVLYEGQVLDGRNRERAGERLGIPVPAVKWDGQGGTPLDFVFSENVYRRSLTTELRGQLGDRFASLLEEEERLVRLAEKKNGRAKKVANLPPPKNTGKTRDRAAKMAGTSSRTVGDARKVRKKGTAELQAAVDSGTIPVYRAAKIADLTPAQQAAEINRETKKVRKQAEQTLLREAFGAGGTHLETARRGLEKAAKAIHGFDAAKALRAIQKAQDALADDIARLLARARN